MNINIQQAALKSNDTAIKNLGDFASPLWAEIACEKVRDDLLRCYLANKDNIPQFSAATVTQREKYKERRDSKLITCFTYAFGFLSDGESIPLLYHLNQLDYSNLLDQKDVLNNTDMIDFIKTKMVNAGTFLDTLNQLRILPVSELDDLKLKDVNPVMAFIYPGRDYHFVKPDIYKTANGPIILFSSKNSISDISKDFTLKEFIQEYKEITKKYVDPVVIGTPKSFLNRELNITDMTMTCSKVEFKTARRFLI